MTDPARLCCVRLQRRRARSTTPPRVRAGRQRAQQPAARLRSLPPESAVRRAKGGGRGGGHAGRVGGGQDAARCNRQLKQRIAACESMPELCSVIEQHAAELNKKTTLPFGPWARPWMSTLRFTAGAGVLFLAHAGFSWAGERASRYPVHPGRRPPSPPATSGAPPCLGTIFWLWVLLCAPA